MLEAMAALILAIVGAILMMMILAYGIYIAFSPLKKTVKNGIVVTEAQAEETIEKRLLGEKMPQSRVAKYA